MVKRIVLILLAVCSIVSYSAVASASKFMCVATSGVLALADDEKWEKTYNTDGGKIKIRFRRLHAGTPDKKYHLIIWMNDKRITEGYCPINKYGYWFKIFKDRDTNRIFVDLEMQNRVVVFGYEPKSQKLEKYIDSKNYWSDDPTPTMALDTNGNLVLLYVGDKSEYTRRYTMFWDEEKRWFGYKDTTTPRPVAPPPVYSSPKTSYSSGSNYSAPQYDEVEYEDVYYEGS